MTAAIRPSVWPAQGVGDQGAGFIGGAVVRRLLRDMCVQFFNFDKFGYASDLRGIEAELARLGPASAERHHLLKLDLADSESTAEAVRRADPDLVLHLAAESHDDRLIDGPGTFSLLQAVRSNWEALSEERRERFRFAAHQHR